VRLRGFQNLCLSYHILLSFSPSLPLSLPPSLLLSPIEDGQLAFALVVHEEEVAGVRILEGGREGGREGEYGIWRERREEGREKRRKIRHGALDMQV